MGPKPSINYYVDPSQKSLEWINKYNQVPEYFDLQAECLKYLEKDVLGLLEIMTKVSFYYWNEYKINVTSYATLPSLALSIFMYYFKDEDLHIKMIKGPLQHFITQCYFGGNSNIF